MLSAWNRIEGTVEEVRNGAVSTEVRIGLGGGDRLSATVTADAAKNLVMEPGVNVVAIIKESDVMIAKPLQK